MPTSTGLRGRAREYAKLGMRRILYRRGLELSKSPYANRVAASLHSLGLGTVLDVGANIGQYASALRASGFAGDIVSVEPLEDAFRHLARRSARDERWTAVRNAVGSSRGELVINVAANSYASSALPMGSLALADPEAAFLRTESVPMTTVSDLVTDHRLDPATSLLKIDTQGFERHVLDGAADLLGTFAAVQLELSFVALYEGQSLFDELVDRMVGHGYVLFGMDAGFSDPATGRTLQCDGLFVLGSRL